MGTTFGLSGVTLSSFRMCHINLRFNNLRFTIYLVIYLIGFLAPFGARSMLLQASTIGIQIVTKVIMEEKFHLLVALTRLVTVNDRNIDTYYFICEPT